MFFRNIYRLPITIPIANILKDRVLFGLFEYKSIVNGRELLDGISELKGDPKFVQDLVDTTTDHIGRVAYRYLKEGLVLINESAVLFEPTKQTPAEFGKTILEQIRQGHRLVNIGSIEIEGWRGYLRFSVDAPEGSRLFVVKNGHSKFRRLLRRR